MGRSFTSVRMEVRVLTERWERAARTLPGRDREYGLRVAQMARKHSSECFYAFDDPLEAAVFSVLIEILKMREEAGTEGARGAGEGATGDRETPGGDFRVDP